MHPRSLLRSLALAASLLSTSSNLAYSNLNKDTPDVSTAARQARAALDIVPYWHYTRDILLPQILTAKAKQK